jgi:5-methylcytosine-specific restriction endonuclease McrA
MARSVGEQQTLSTAAKLFRDKLISQVVGPISFRSNITTESDEYIDGWWATIATFADPAVDVSVWLDTYARHDNKCFWIGFSAEKKRAILKLVKVLDETPPIFSDKDINTDSSEQYSRMKVALQTNLFARPVQENYPRDSYFLGIYYRDLPSDEAKLYVNVENSTKWIMQILSSLDDFSCEEGADHYSSEENRLRVSFHLRRERNPTLARLCKERDGYRCQVCKVRLDEVYGDLAKAFAEAHHIVPLSKIDGPVDRDVGHLKTVCANCHRMLHRLHGNENDLDELRLKYSQAKKNYRSA